MDIDLIRKLFLDSNVSSAQPLTSMQPYIRASPLHSCTPGQVLHKYLLFTYLYKYSQIDTGTSFIFRQ